MLERPQVPLDGSALAEQVLPYAALLARQLAQPLALLSVIPDAGHELNPIVSLADAAIASMLEERRVTLGLYLDSVAARFVQDMPYLTVPRSSAMSRYADDKTALKLLASIWPGARL